MAHRKRQPPKRRRPPTDVEVAAKHYKLAHGTMLDRLPEEHLALAEEVAEKASLLQRNWSDATEWMRRHGITKVPQGLSVEKYVEQLQQLEAVRLLRHIRILPIDRPLFGFCEWLRPDWPAEFMPDELDDWVCNDEEFPPHLGAPFPRRPIPRLEELPNARPIGRAFAWQDGRSWVYTTYRFEAPLNAAPANRYDLAGRQVLQVRQGESRKLVYDAKRSVSSQ